MDHHGSARRSRLPSAAPASASPAHPPHQHLAPPWRPPPPGRRTGRRTRKAGSDDRHAQAAHAGTRSRPSPVPLSAGPGRSPRHPGCAAAARRVSTVPSSTTAPPRSPTSGTRPRTTGTRPRPTLATPSRTLRVDLFTAAYDRLTGLGIRTPRLLFADPELRRSALGRGRGGGRARRQPGGPVHPATPRPPKGPCGGWPRPCAPCTPTPTPPRQGRRRQRRAARTAVRASRSSSNLGALADLAEAAARDPRIAVVREALYGRLHALAGRVRPRGRVGLVHGELGPDHVLVDEYGHPALIDIEGRSLLRRRVGSTLSCASASTTPTKGHRAPTASTRTGCCFTAWPCTSRWSPARSGSLDGDFPASGGVHAGDRGTQHGADPRYAAGGPRAMIWGRAWSARRGEARDGAPVLVGFAALAMTGAALMGIAGSSTGPGRRLRPRVLRPRPGVRLGGGAAGMSLYMFIGPFQGPTSAWRPSR